VQFDGHPLLLQQEHKTIMSILFTLLWRLLIDILKTFPCDIALATVESCHANLHIMSPEN